MSKASDLVDVTSVVTQSDYDQLASAQQDKINENGWYFYLDNNTGPTERVTQEATVINGIVFFTSFLPNSDPCGPGGDYRLYSVNFKNGLPGMLGNLMVMSGVAADKRYKTLGQGMPSQPVFHFNPITKKSTLFIQSSDATVVSEEVNVGKRPMMVTSWQKNTN